MGQVIICAMNDFYTGTGDDGYTGLLGDERVPKHGQRPETLGTVDEATAAIGLARATCQTEETGSILIQVQRDLYNLMAEVAATPKNAARFRVIDDQQVDWLEAQIRDLSDKVKPPEEFILPGDSQAGAALAMARTIVRRAERRVAQLMHNQEVDNKQLLRYLNRLSSLLFALELLENQAAGKTHTTLAKA
jgi:cob(I)alamin adenosyltransferase